MFLLYTQSYGIPGIPPFWHTDTSHVSIQPNEETHRLNKILHVTHIKSLSATKQIVVHFLNLFNEIFISKKCF